MFALPGFLETEEWTTSFWPMVPTAFDGSA
jgi:hypothetical protein